MSSFGAQGMSISLSPRSFRGWGDLKWGATGVSKPGFRWLNSVNIFPGGTALYGFANQRWPGQICSFSQERVVASTGTLAPCTSSPACHKHHHSLLSQFSPVLNFPPCPVPGGTEIAIQRQALLILTCPGSR